MEKECAQGDMVDFEVCPGYRELQATLAGQHEQFSVIREMTQKQLDRLEKGQDDIGSKMDILQKHILTPRTITVRNGSIRNISIDQAIVDMWERLAKQEKGTIGLVAFSNIHSGIKSLGKLGKTIMGVSMTLILAAIVSIATGTPIVDLAVKIAKIFI